MDYTTLILEIVKLLLPFIGLLVGWLGSKLAKRSENKKLKALLCQQVATVLLLRDQLEAYKEVATKCHASNQFRNTRNAAYKEGEYNQFYQHLKFTGTLSPNQLVALLNKFEDKGESQ